jgi:hypothetical protein
MIASAPRSEGNGEVLVFVKRTLGSVFMAGRSATAFWTPILLVLVLSDYGLDWLERIESCEKRRVPAGGAKWKSYLGIPAVGKVRNRDQ